MSDEPPVTADFLTDTAEEAAFQVERWGETHDADKDDSFWFWTLGHIVGKAIHDDAQTVEKQRHRLRAAAALLLNWDRHIAVRNGLDVGPLLHMGRGGAESIERVAAEEPAAPPEPEPTFSEGDEVVCTSGEFSLIVQGRWYRLTGVNGRLVNPDGIGWYSASEFVSRANYDAAADPEALPDPQRPTAWHIGQRVASTGGGGRTRTGSIDSIRPSGVPEVIWDDAKAAGAQTTLSIHLRPLADPGATAALPDPPPAPTTGTVAWHPDVIQRAHDQLIAYRDWCYEDDRPPKPPFLFPSEAMCAIDALRACGADDGLAAPPAATEEP